MNITDELLAQIAADSRRAHATPIEVAVDPADLPDHVLDAIVSGRPIVWRFRSK